MAWTYLLECADGAFYVGSTIDLAQRVKQHNHGTIGGFTARRRPVRLVWAAEFDRIVDAYATERRIHGWSRAKKRALVDGDLDALKLLGSRSEQGRLARFTAQTEDRAARTRPS